ncbi:MAG: universal stress protein [Acidimicrobiales bacterium]|jgi:nucleotide-binding universal stress UspA family protein
MTEAPTSALIVVGVDGSPPAHAALEYAIEEARLRQARLHITYAYPVMALGVTGSTGKDYYDQVESDARVLLQGLVAAAPSTEGIDVEWLAVPGNPSEVLIEASKEAVLLVVGSRGVGGFMGLIMGSVSTQCVHYSHCPVLVVREGH